MLKHLIRDTPLSRAVSRHETKTFVLTAASALVFCYLDQFVPRWLSVLLFMVWAVLILIPIALAIGPLGRRLGRELNEAAVAQARKRREENAQRPFLPDANGTQDTRR